MKKGYLLVLYTLYATISAGAGGEERSEGGGGEEDQTDQQAITHVSQVCYILVPPLYYSTGTCTTSSF